MIVCVCRAVNDRAIRRAVTEGHDSFDALQFELGVGTCCGKCVAAACAVLCDARAEATADRDRSVERDAQPLRFARSVPAPEVALA